MRTGKDSAPIAFPIVGVGASAGGLEAFCELFRSIPPNTGMTFVLIQHLSPKHLSLLTSIVQKTTEMQVLEVTDALAIQANHVYVIPPNAILEVFHGVLHLSPLSEPHAANLPVDAFFTSLARDQGNLGIGIVLSGTGSDGAQGLREIKADGGITFVQDPAEAKFDGMPKAAIHEATPDYVLTVREIAAEISKIAGHPFVKKALLIEEAKPSAEVEKTLNRIFILLRGATKVDFSNYKYPTIIRRMKRRMVLHRIETLKHYLTFLQTTSAEITALFEDLLINVTDFFRDVEAFDSLKANIFPALLKNRQSALGIRIWVPGCSTGEEVYSIAIALLEVMGEDSEKFPLQIYGTDICQSALKIARAGFYPETASKHLSVERLERFFRREQGGYRISRIVRDCCIFSVQDVISQPPINRLDLLSCRNLMIYLSQSVQRKLMETFFYALNSDGYLMLGSTEGVGSAVSLFSIVDKKNKIFVKKGSSVNIQRDYPMSNINASSLLASAQTTEVPARRVQKSFDPVFEAEKIVLDQYSPAWVLINESCDIIQFRGDTEKFVAPASGQPSWNLMKMLRDGLSPHVRVLVHSALKEHVPHHKDGLKLVSDGFARIVRVEVVPISSSGTRPHFLVIFKEQETQRIKGGLVKATKKGGPGLDPKNSEIMRLSEELELSQSSLKTIIEDLNATNEEMQTANEEISSANEELQSTIEELETAKEELQSTNEELTTANDELSSRNSDLDHLSNDLINVLSNANVSIIMIGPDLRIRRFTPMAEKRLKLISTDLGRNLMDINLGFAIENFEDRILGVIQNMATCEFETCDRQGHWYSLQIRPYRTTDNKIDGAVIVFINIDDVKARETQALAAERYAEGIIQTVRDPLIVLEQDLHVEHANQAFYDTFQVTAEATIGRPFYKLGNGQWNIPSLRTLLEDVLPKKLEVRDFKVSHEFEKIGRKQMVLNAKTLEWKGQKKLLLLIALHDETEKLSRD